MNVGRASEVARRFAWAGALAAPSASAVPAATPAHQVRAAVLTTLNDVEPVWRQLSLQADSTVFQNWDVFRSWVRGVASTCSCDWFVAALFDAKTGQPLLLLPLVKRREGGLDVIEGADLGVADFFAPVIARGFVPTVSEMLVYWAAIKSVLPKADILRLSKLPQRIGRSRNPLLLLPNVNCIKLSNLKADLDADWETWLAANVPEKLRMEVAVRRRKLGKRGAISFGVAKTEDEAERFFTAMLEQRQARFRALGRADILDNPSIQGFYRSLVTPGDPASIGVIQALRSGDEIVATGFGLVYNGAFHMIFPTFRGDGWRNYSPGLQLFLYSMEWAAKSGLKHYDFTIGGEVYKRDLGAEEFPLYEKLTALSLRGKTVVYADRLRRFVRRNPRLAKITSRLRGAQGD